MEKIITDKDEARKAGLLKTGMYFTRTDNGQKMYLPLWYGNRLDLENMILYTEKDGLDNYPQFPDMNELVREKKIKECYLYRKFDIDLTAFKDCRTRNVLTKEKAEMVCLHFKDRGFPVTVDAIMHNYNAWLSDMKSGYRDEQNGYHLFTPCGCNELSFRASTLFKEADWQTTYQW